MFGVTRKDLKKVLSVCLIGKFVDVDHDNKIERLKQSVENTLEALGEQDKSEYMVDYSDQLNRWLQDYPNVQVYNEPPHTGADPNVQAFPLPKPILFDPLLMRKWIEDWEAFDVEVPDDGAWISIALVNESLGDTHEIYANIVKSNRDENLPELDMTIDGEAAWNVIEVDILRNDKTTEEQEKTWRAREKRKNWNDPTRQAKRRSEIANAFIARHEMDPNVMTPYLSFYENLEIAWKQFLEICQKDLILPKRTAPDTTQMHMKKSEKRKTSAGSRHSDNSSVHSIGVEPNVLTPDLNDSEHAAGNMDYVQNNDIPNNEKYGSQSYNDTEEQNNAFLTLAEDDGDGNNQPLVLAEGDDDPTNEPVVLEPISDHDPLTTETDHSGDQVDDNRNAVDRETSGLLSRASDSTMDIIERNREATDNDIGGREADSSDKKSVRSHSSNKSPDHERINSRQNNDNSSEQGTDGVLFLNNESQPSVQEHTDNEIQNNDFDRLVLNEDPNSQTQEEAEQLMNELEFENNSSNGNLEEF